MEAIPPVEFTQIGLDANGFKKQDARSWRGPCPRCGGKRRFVIFTDNTFPLWHGWCDDCGEKVKYWERHRTETPESEIQRETRRQAAQQAHADRLRFAEARLAQLTIEEIWSVLHKRMGQVQRGWWRDQGIPDSIQDYLELGWLPDKPYKVGEELLHSDAFTIPYFHNTTDGKHFETMQYRLSNAPTADRYRFEYGMPATYFNTTPDQPLEDTVIICEGAKKAIVLSLIAHANQTVLAVPSKSSAEWFNLPTLLEGKRVFVMLDPDAGDQARKLTAAIGREARTVSLFGKVDDLINQHGFKQTDLDAALRQGVK